MLAFVVLTLAAAAEPEQIDDNKALVCLTLMKVRMTEDQEVISAFVDQHEFPREDIRNKLISEMLLYCYDHATNETVTALSAEMDTFQLNDDLRKLVPMPSAPFQSASQLEVRPERKLRFSNIVERAKTIQQLMEYLGLQDTWYSGKMGMIYLLAVFAVFAYGMFRLFKGLTPNAKKGKKSK